MTKRTYGWLRGFLAALFSGATSAVTMLTLTDEIHVRHALQIAAVNAVVGAALYLAQSPLPPPEEE